MHQGPVHVTQTLATVAAKLGGESWSASHTRRAIGSDSGDLDLDFDDVFGRPGSREEGGALSAAPSAEVSMRAVLIWNRHSVATCCATDGHVLPAAPAHRLAFHAVATASI